MLCIHLPRASAPPTCASPRGGTRRTSRRRCTGRCTSAATGSTRPGSRTRSSGLREQDDARGVLQDVHWSPRLIGYYPTYALGNLIAGQLWAKAHLDIPGLDGRIGAGELLPLREWLRENVHRHGAKFASTELLQ